MNIYIDDPFETIVKVLLASNTALKRRIQNTQKTITGIKQAGFPQVTMERLLNDHQQQIAEDEEQLQKNMLQLFGAITWQTEPHPFEARRTFESRIPRRENEKRIVRLLHEHGEPTTWRHRGSKQDASGNMAPPYLMPYEYMVDGVIVSYQPSWIQIVVGATLQDAQEGRAPVTYVKIEPTTNWKEIAATVAQHQTG